MHYSYPQDRINTQVIYRFVLVQVECTSYVTVTLGWYDSSLCSNERKNSLSAKAEFIDMALNALSFLVERSS